MSELLQPMLALAISCGGTWWLTRPKRRLKLLDIPGDRSLHDRPIPRTGGVALAAALAATVGAAGAVTGSLPQGLGPIAVGYGVVWAVSFADDVRAVPFLLRLTVHLVAASILLATDFAIPFIVVPVVGTIPLGFLGPLVTMLFVVWFINLYNFMDGMDGFAGGMGALGFALLAWLGWTAGRDTYAALALTVAAANAGFLVFNFPPARVFLGDSGSVPMGFLAAAFALWGEREGIFAMWVPLLIFSPFVIDATVTLLRRALHREPVWRPHRSHFYQRAALLGWGHRRTVLGEYALMAGSGLSAVAAHRSGSAAAGLGALLLWFALYAALAIWITRRERARG